MTVPTRRERLRQATLDEIVQASRDLLRAHEEVSVRAVAGAMGLTPPALYRYVEGHAGLVQLVERHIFADVVSVMAQARDRYPESDPAARIVAAATAFRAWALAKPAEFRMVFAAARADEDAAGDPAACDPEGAELFVGLFGELFAALWQKYRFPVPDASELDGSFRDLCAGYSGPSAERHLLDAFGDLGPGLLWLFKLAWARLYGIVTLEVFGHIDPELIASAAVYAAMMREIGGSVGLAGEWERLRGLLEAPGDRERQHPVRRDAGGREQPLEGGHPGLRQDTGDPEGGGRGR